MEGTLVKDAYLEMLSDSTHFKWTQCLEYILNKFDYKISDIEEYNILEIEKKMKIEFTDFWKESIFNDNKKN